MRILVAENDARARWALQMLLGQEPGLAIAECADLGSLVAQVEAFKPDLVLLDWELPGRRWRCCTRSTGPPPGPR
jgi:DNA-binding response OmpR family regulator